MHQKCQQDDQSHERVVDEFSEDIPEEQHQRVSAIVQLVFRVLLVYATSAEEPENPFFVRFFAGRESKFIRFNLLNFQLEAINCARL